MVTPLAFCAYHQPMLPRNHLHVYSGSAGQGIGALKLLLRAIMCGLSVMCFWAHDVVLRFVRFDSNAIRTLPLHTRNSDLRVALW